MAYNNFNWTVATKQFPDRIALLPEATAFGDKLLSIQRTANFLDTVACVRALWGKFSEAIALEQDALSGDPNNAAFKKQLALVSSASPVDCAGEE